MSTSADQEQQQYDHLRRRAEYPIVERQRIEHLVLGRARPVPVVPRKPKGISKAEWKIRRAALLKEGATLLPDVEPFVAMRERWSHKRATPETLERFAEKRSRPGSIARLHDTGAIDTGQLGAAQQIAEAYRAVVADVTVRTASLETRVDGGGHGRVEQLQLGRVHADLAYTWWRQAVGGCLDALLAVIVHDVGLTIVAREYGMSLSCARAMLCDGLDIWSIARRRTGDRAARIAG